MKGAFSMLPSYLTVPSYGEYELIIQKSRFIAHIARTETEEAAQAFIGEIKKKHKDATHNCSAYLIGEHDQIQKANDDGEPSGTAGVPILEVLKKKGLKDTTVVVTRYFGGIKLGAGGLIRAYGKTTSEGLTNVGIIERKLKQIISVSIEYPLLGKMENELRSSNYQIKDIHYLEKVEIEVFVDSDQIENYKAWITDLTNGQGIMTDKEKIYAENFI